MLSRTVAAPLCAAALALGLIGCGPDLPPADVAAGSPTDLEIRTLKPGSGAVARAGQIVQVHYTGWLYDERQPGRKGAAFDSSRTRGEPFAFPLGAGRVIRGWDEGVVGMQVGEVRDLAIPAWLAYGSRGAGGVIPPDQPLLFEVELVAIDSVR